MRHMWDDCSHEVIYENEAAVELLNQNELVKCCCNLFDRFVT